MRKKKRYVCGLLLLCALCLVSAADAKAGRLTNTWKKVGSRRVYLDVKGERVKGRSLIIKGIKYKFDEKGFMKAGLRRTAKGIRYQKENGVCLKKGWKKTGSNWYYFNKKGYAARKKWIGNYYVGKEGKMLTSTWIGSRFVDASGKKVTANSLNLVSPSAILVDGATGKVIYQKNAAQKRANASTTKIMTAILALEKGNEDDIVTFSPYAAGQEAVKLYANPGEQFRLGDLMYALLLPSYNDVAAAIGEHIGGSSSSFARMMNEKAKEVGCRNTAFVTASGLDEGNHSTTAADLARMARYAFGKKPFREIIKTRTYNFASTSSGRQFTVRTTNQFLNEMPGAAGIKTGYTSKAGHCFVGALRSNAKTYFSVVLGAPTSAARWGDTNRLMNFARSEAKYEN